MKSVLYTLFFSTINLICPVCDQSRTETGPYEKAVIFGLLDTYRNYDPDQPLFLKPNQTELMQPLIAARIIVNFISAVVPISYPTWVLTVSRFLQNGVGWWHSIQRQARRFSRAVDPIPLRSFSVDERCGLITSGQSGCRSDKECKQVTGFWATCATWAYV